MNNIIYKISFLLLIVLCPRQAYCSDADIHKPKVAVVLSGGGAKGMAHIGVLKVLEKAGIPVDIITGTSMGSLIGGLYSIGYRAQALDSLVSNQNWSFLLSDKTQMKYQSLYNRKKQYTYFITRDLNLKKKKISSGGFIQGKNLESLFYDIMAGYNDSLDFNKLPIPFACVATNIIDNTEHVFHNGLLYNAMRSSMSMPGVFSPMRIGDEILVDGGLKNNFPVDIAREMGADYVIGVTVQGAPKTADDITDASDVLGQIVDVNCKNKYYENLTLTDVPINVNTKGYSSSSFTKVAIDTLISRGEQAALKHWDELMALKSKLGITEENTLRNGRAVLGKSNPLKIKINKIELTGVTSKDRRYLTELSLLEKNLKDSIRVTKIEKIVAALQTDLYYNESRAYYKQNADGSYNVEITASDKNESRLNLGARFDNEEMASLKLNGSFIINTKGAPVDIETDLRLGKRIKTGVNVALNWKSWTKMTVSYLFNHSEFDICENGKRALNMTYNYHGVDLHLLDFSARNLSFNLGPKFSYYTITNILRSDVVTDYETNDFTSSKLFCYVAELTYNSEDNWLFPSAGSSALVSYDYNTDDFIHYKSGKGFSTLRGYLRKSFAVTPNLVLRPMVMGRFVFGSETPFLYRNYIGGKWFGHYIDTQLPVAGVGKTEVINDKMLAGQLTGQYQLWHNSYIVADVSYFTDGDEVSTLFSGKSYFGCQASYCYDTSFVGPISATIGSSSKTKKLYFFLNVGFEF